jgi:hypothetical protein
VEVEERKYGEYTRKAQELRAYFESQIALWRRTKGNLEKRLGRGIRDERQRREVTEEIERLGIELGEFERLLTEYRTGLAELSSARTAYLERQRQLTNQVIAIGQVSGGIANELNHFYEVRKEVIAAHGVLRNRLSPRRSEVRELVEHPQEIAGFQNWNAVKGVTDKVRKQDEMISKSRRFFRDGVLLGGSSRFLIPSPGQKGRDDLPFSISLRGPSSYGLIQGRSQPQKGFELLQGFVTQSQDVLKRILRIPSNIISSSQKILARSFRFLLQILGDIIFPVTSQIRFRKIQGFIERMQEKGRFVNRAIGSNQVPVGKSVSRVIPDNGLPVTPAHYLNLDAKANDLFPQSQVLVPSTDMRRQIRNEGEPYVPVSTAIPPAREEVREKEEALTPLAIAQRQGYATLRPILETSRQAGNILPEIFGKPIRSELRQAASVFLNTLIPPVQAAPLALSSEASIVLDSIRNNTRATAIIVHVEKLANPEAVENLFRYADLFVGENRAQAHEVLFVADRAKDLSPLKEQWKKFFTERYQNPPEGVHKIFNHVRFYQLRDIPEWLLEGIETVWLGRHGELNEKAVPLAAREKLIHADMSIEGLIVDFDKNPKNFGTSFLQATRLLFDPDKSGLRYVSNAYVQESRYSLSRMQEIFAELVASRQTKIAA